MKPAKFRLESVLQLYTMREDDARAELGRAVQARGHAEAALESAYLELEARTKAYAEHRASREFSAETHAQHWAALQGGHAACKAQEARVALAKQAEAKARSVFIEARRQREMMRKLRARHTEQERLAGLHTEEQALADFFNANRNRRLGAETQEARR